MKKNKNKIMRLASGLLVVALMTTCAISGTFAKYTSSTSGNDSATVAKWSFSVNEEEIAVSPATTVEFNLFETVNDSDGKTESDVKSGSLIAPGTSGSFELGLVNNSEVNAKYTILLEETNEGGVYLQYSLDEANWVDSIAELTMIGLTAQDIDMENGSASHTVYWRWVYETDSGEHTGQTDVTDTGLGIGAQTNAATVTIKATVNAWQVN